MTLPLLTAHFSWPLPFLRLKKLWPPLCFHPPSPPANFWQVPNKETCQGRICQGKVADVNQQSLNVRWNYSAFMWWMKKSFYSNRGFRERYSPGSMQSKSFLTDWCSNALLINAAMNDWWERKITKCKGRFIMVCTRPWKNGNLSLTFSVFSKAIRFPIPNIHVAF